MIEQRETAPEPGDLAGQLTLQSLSSHLDDLRQQLAEEKTLREKEIIELRLKGAVTKDGTIPLTLLSHLARNLADGLLATSQLIKSGREVKGRIPVDLIKTLDLRLAGIGHGSTRLFITGNNAPNLFGYSLLEESLQHTFTLLNASSAEELTQTASQIGRRGLHRINGLLKTLVSADLEANIEWASPSGEPYRWEGNQARILTLTSSLDSLTVAAPETIEVRGVLVMLSLRGQFEIKSEEGQPFRGKMPLELLEQARKVHIGDDVVAELERKLITNETTGFEKAYYTLVSIA